MNKYEKALENLQIILENNHVLGMPTLSKEDFECIRELVGKTQTQTLLESTISDLEFIVHSYNDLPLGKDGSTYVTSDIKEDIKGVIWEIQYGMKKETKKKPKRKFDWCDFTDGYGTLFDADLYDAGEAIAITEEELGYTPEDDLRADEDWVRWVPNVPSDDRFYLDLPEEGIQGTYMSCKKEDKGAFKCWRVTAV